MRRPSPKVVHIEIGLPCQAQRWPCGDLPTVRQLTWSFPMVRSPRDVPGPSGVRAVSGTVTMYFSVQYCTYGITRRSWLEHRGCLLPCCPLVVTEYDLLLPA